VYSHFLAAQADSTHTMPPHARRALSQVGGEVRCFGDPRLAEALSAAATPPEDADPRELTHGFHTWPARLHPHTARALAALAPPGHAIYDPFMGGGTVLVEARLAGRRAVGGDVSPLATEVAWARTRHWHAAQRNAFLQAAHRVADEARARVAKGLRVPAELWETEREWYDAPALNELWAILVAARTLKSIDHARMVRACVSSLVVKASRQQSDSVAHLDPDHAYVPRGRVATWFERRAEELVGGLEALAPRLAPGSPEPELRTEDARRPAPLEGLGPVSVVTSPPYPGVYDYVSHHKRRYRLLGLAKQGVLEREIGARRTQHQGGFAAGLAAYAEDMGRVLAVWREVLAPDGLVLMVVGDGESPEGSLRVLPVLEAQAKTAGLGVAAGVTQRRLVRSRLGKGRTKCEHTLALRRKEPA
jgi:hypothetical protein